LVCFSRIYVGGHYLLDVLGGVLLGIGISFLFVWRKKDLETFFSIMDRLTRRLSNNSWSKTNSFILLSVWFSLISIVIEIVNNTFGTEAVFETYIIRHLVKFVSMLMQSLMIRMNLIIYFMLCWRITIWNEEEHEDNILQIQVIIYSMIVYRSNINLWFYN